MEINDIFGKIEKLKTSSGTHSPSIDTIKSILPEGHIKVDACFLSNPYATDLFMEYFNNELILDNKRLRDLLEFYPPQNRDIANKVSLFLGVSPESLIVGNGAIELIQAIMHNFVGLKLAIAIPTFSSYYEFAKSSTEVVFYSLKESENFELNLDDYSRWIHLNDVSDVVLVNPNNPNGSYAKSSEIIKFLESVRNLNAVILDESFIHFAFEDDDINPIDSNRLVQEYPNLILVKSMSKDFGVAGLRCGYAVMHPNRVRALLSNGYLWNSNGLSSYFFELYTRSEFQIKYEVIRKKYIMNAMKFQEDLAKIEGIKIYPTKANFTLVKIKNGLSSFDVMVRLLLNHGVYVRECSDKIGLDGNFLRVACRSFEENLIIIEAMKSM